jgi:hypothetical protein
MAVATMDQPPLSLRVKVVLGVGVLLVLGLSASITTVQLRRRARVRRTQRLLLMLNRILHRDVTGGGYRPPRTDRNDGSTGLQAFNEYFGLYADDETVETALEHAEHRRGPDHLLTSSWTYPAKDSWGHVIQYRCPGPVHSHGWDFYSLGRNGEDELGQGDDIVVGEDIANIGSLR